MSVVSVVGCEVEVSASGSSLVQRSPTECGVSECDHETSITRRPWTTGGCCVMVGKKRRTVDHSVMLSGGCVDLRHRADVSAYLLMCL